MPLITVAVPDRISEAVVRNLAEHLRAGREVICLVRPDGIADEHMPPLVAQMTAMLRVAAGELTAVPIPQGWAH